MALTTTASEAGQIVRDRVVDSARRMTKLADEANALTSRAADAVEDGVYAAKRAVRRGVAQLEDLQAEGSHRVKRHPFKALGLAAGIGLALGIAIGWVASREPRPEIAAAVRIGARRGGVPADGPVSAARSRPFPACLVRFERSAMDPRHRSGGRTGSALPLSVRVEVLSAVAIWVVGGWAIHLIRGAFGRAMRARRVDATLTRYLDASANVLLKALVLITILGVLGIQTTSFAALMAAAGIAIGAAWAGMLANFAAGLFLLTFRPFKVGDLIAAGGITGTVREIGLFVTSIDTPDQVLTFVGNNKLFADNVQNFSANPFRRVDLTAQVPSSVNLLESIGRLREQVRRVPNVLAQPEPSVEILTYNPSASVVTVRPYCRSEDYWQVYFDTNRVITNFTAAPPLSRKGS